MDVTLASLGCSTVPVTGSVSTTGTFVANADGSYTDNTRTTGSVTFPLAASCLSISSTPVTCEKAGSIFPALGWTTSACTTTNGQCNCSLSADQAGGLGLVSDLVTPQGKYTTSVNTLSTGDGNYSYCASGATLTLTPQMATALTGSVVLTKSGTGAGGGSSMGGAGGSGGSPAMAGNGGTTPMGGAGGSGGSAGGSQTGTLPCDIYAAANNKCVAAHSTIRALFGAFSGNLYQVKRASDSTTKDIARTIGRTERQIWRIIQNLKEGGMLRLRKNGRRHHFTINFDAPLLHPTIENLSLRSLMEDAVEQVLSQAPDICQKTNLSGQLPD